MIFGITNYLSYLNSNDIQQLKLNIKNPRESYQLVKSLINVKEAFNLKNWSLTELYNKNRLVLSYKRIEKIPNLSLFKNLQKLYLNNNEIGKIPETLPNSLEYLDLRDNKIEKISTTLPSFLQILWLNYIQIQEIPTTLPSSLQELWLNNNQIKEIPEKYKNIVKFYNKL